ncbi:ATP-dependent nuclease [Priestia megaterium]|uniref:ATP-dependent nuclease n=1 Tax=Priestia megaterium TaxID=1404 RepID=UPI000EF9C91D|nr:AAA family ATPase [Priestia megaterium]RMA90230.1 putative AbiEii toxin of type IV toxin-antitoxin system [Priestia megaterium]
MRFEKVKSVNAITATQELVIFLIHDSWNDWWEYQTLYSMYISYAGKLEWIGSTKIANINTIYKGNTISDELPEQFEKLEENYVSLGQDSDYYKNLNKLGADIRENILDKLNDLALKQHTFEKVRWNHVVFRSILRSVSSTSVRGQYKRLAEGSSKLTSYEFKYKLPRPKLNEVEEELFKDSYLNVKVQPRSTPPTNLHVLIGRNGVGKTNLLKSFVTCLLNEDYGEIEYNVEFNEKLFANVITLSFSSFDNNGFNFVKEQTSKSMPYYEIGLMKFEEGNKNENSPKARTHKSVDDLCEEFMESLKILTKNGKVSLWKKAIRTLNSDLIFSSIGIEALINPNYYEKIPPLFKHLSSGHMNVLLTITKLVEVVEERSILIMDEPETHLHPPLIAALMRVVTDLLIYRNAVGLLATHSPVVVQEVPAKCVTIMNRKNKFTNLLRPKIETFGENVGTLTREIFGLETNNSGYHLRLREAVDECENYSEVLDYFDNSLGAEARTIVRSLLLAKKEKSE